MCDKHVSCVISKVLSVTGRSAACPHSRMLQCLPTRIGETAAFLHRQRVQEGVWLALSMCW